MDSESSFDIIHKEHVSSPTLQYLFEEIEALLRRKDWQIVIKHILRSADRCYDVLAHKGHA